MKIGRHIWVATVHFMMTQKSDFPSSHLATLSETLTQVRILGLDVMAAPPVPPQDWDFITTEMINLRISCVDITLGRKKKNYCNALMNP